MARSACAVAALSALCLAALMAGASSEVQRLDLIRLLSGKPWLTTNSRWERGPRVEDLQAPGSRADDLSGPEPEAATSDTDNGEDYQNMMNEELRVRSEKRSALATALNLGRRRRQPSPALGLLNDMDSFFDSLRDNLETISVLSPQERANLISEPPSVVHAPSNGGGGGGVGYRKLHALRPLRPTGNIRSYNRRSFMEAGGAYPGANSHDPALLWTGLGR